MNQIISREAIRQSAHEAFEAKKTIDDCPVGLTVYHHEWKEEFRLALFEATCGDDPCSL
jgi:hypothetical protein